MTYGGKIVDLFILFSFANEDYSRQITLGIILDLTKHFFLSLFLGKLCDGDSYFAKRESFKTKIKRKKADSIRS